VTCEVRLARSPFEEALEEGDDEERRIVWIDGTPAQHGPQPGALVQAAVLDITERKAAERRLEKQERELRASRQALQEANAKVLKIQDEERRVIARELHDDCCQQLALLIITANSLQTLTSDPIARKLRTMSGQLKQVLESIRQVAYGLHPAMWETTGIEEAARGYIHDFASVTQLEVRFTSDDIPAALPQNVTTCLFRTLQETLHNIVKYAHASTVTVHLEKAENSINLTVKDDGKGFDTKSGRSVRGLGFISMQERVRLLDGALEIHSRPGRGTTVHVSLPLPRYS
jgi:signal transduction histidine kinase